jgi:hypothetical protein
MANEQELGRLVIRLIMEVKDIRKDLAGLQGDMKDFSTKSSTFIDQVKAGWIGLTMKVGIFMAAFYAAKRMIYDTGKEIASTTMEIQRQANIIGMDVVAFQKWQYAAKMSDVNAGELSIGIKLLSKNMEAASKGSGEAARYFEAMGISVKNSSGDLRPLNDVMLDVMDKFASWEDGPRKIAIALQLFGRSGQQLIPLLNQGKEGFEKFSQEAENLGIILSPNLIKKGSEAEDIFKRLESQFTATKLSLAPLVLESTRAINSILSDFNRLDKWLKENKATDWFPWMEDVNNWIKENTLGKWLVSLGIKKAPIGKESFGKGFETPKGLPPIVPDPKEIEAVEKLKKKYEELGISLQNLTDPAGAGERALRLLFDEIIRATEKPATKEMEEWFDKLISRFRELDAAKGWKETIEKVVNAEDALGDKTSELVIELLKLKDPIRADEVSFNNFIVKLLEGIPIEEDTENAVKKLWEVFRKLGDEQGKLAIKGAEAARLDMENSQQTQLALAQLDSAYKRGAVNITNYFAQKKVILNNSTVASIELLEQEKSEIEKWSESKQKTARLMEIDTKIRAAQLEGQRQGIQLNLDETKSLEGLAIQRAEWGQKLAESKGDWRGVWENQIKSLEALREQALATDGLDEEVKNLIRDYYALQIQEAEAQRDMDVGALMRVGGTKAVIATNRELADTFQNLIPNTIKMSTDSIGGFFKDLIDGTKSAKQAFADMANGFAKEVLKMIVDLGMLILKMMLFKVIASVAGLEGGGPIGPSLESLAGQRGGMVRGPSGIDKVPAMLTAGEYVLSVEDVELLRRGLLPALHLAAGGQVSNIGSVFQEGGKSEINLVNIVDTRLIDRYLASSAGQNAVLNVIGSNAETIKRRLR